MPRRCGRRGAPDSADSGRFGLAGRSRAGSIRAAQGARVGDNPADSRAPLPPAGLDRSSAAPRRRVEGRIPRRIGRGFPFRRYAPAASLPGRGAFQGRSERAARFASRQEYPPERMAPQLFVLPHQCRPPLDRIGEMVVRMAEDRRQLETPGRSHLAVRRARRQRLINRGCLRVRADGTDPRHLDKIPPKPTETGRPDILECPHVATPPTTTPPRHGYTIGGGLSVGAAGQARVKLHADARSVAPTR